MPWSNFTDAYTKAKNHWSNERKNTRWYSDISVALSPALWSNAFSSSCTSVSLAAGATASQFIKVPATAETRWSCARRGSMLCWQTGCQGGLPSSSALRIKCKSHDSVLSLARDGEWMWDTLSQQETGAQVHRRGHLVAGLARTCRKVGDEKRAGIFPAEMPA